MDTESPADSLVVTTVRLPSDLKDALAKQAAGNQRTLSSEIVKRLTDSLNPADVSKRARELRNKVANDAIGLGVQDANGTYIGGRNNPHEAMLLMLFAELSPERQLALLTLLRG